MSSFSPLYLPKPVPDAPNLYGRDCLKLRLEAWLTDNVALTHAPSASVDCQVPAYHCRTGGLWA